MKRLARVFTSAVLVSAMVATMGGMTAFANTIEVPLTKTVSTDGFTYAPETTFSFSIAAGAAGNLGEEQLGLSLKEGMDEGRIPEGSLSTETKKVKVEAGVLGAVSITYPDEGGFAFGSTQSGMGTPELLYTKDGGKVIFNSDGFSEAGIYHYTISEVNDGYPGVYYDNNTYDMYVYVFRTDAGLEVNNVIVALDGVKQGGEGAEFNDGGITFRNNYGGEGEGEKLTRNVVITKNVTGNQRETNRDFEFTVTASGNKNGENGKINITFSDGRDAVTLDVDNGSRTFNLKDGQTATIHGLAEGSSYSVTETDYSSLGYTTKINGTEVRTINETLANITSTDADQKVIDVTVENNRDVTTPTGIVLSFAPYILLVALAGVFGVLFLRRRKEEF